MRFLHATLAFAVLLTACARTESGPLQPEEVLKNAAKASQSLDSATYNVNGRYIVSSEGNWSASGDLHMDGVVGHGGQQLQMRISDNGTYKSASSPEVTHTATLEIIVPGDDSVFMNLQGFTMQPPSDFFRPELIGQLAGKWWKIPASGEVNPTRVSPDPRVLQAQSQVVRVVHDNGIETVNGRKAYHYTVELDQEKFISYMKEVSAERQEKLDEESLRSHLQQISATGDVWIDEETFQMLRAQWNITGVPVAYVGSLAISFTAEVSNQNAAPEITLPENAEVLSPASFVSVSEPTVHDQVLPGVPPELEDRMVEKLLQDIQQQ